MAPSSRSLRTAAAVLAAGCALAVVVSGCGDDGPAGTTAASVTAPLGAGGSTIPPTTTAKATPPPTVTTPDGAPKVVQFAAPRSFWCMAAHPGQAQALVGWSVPSATKVEVRLDGRRLHQGIRKTLPFAVPAGPPTGIGSTVVFPCRPASHKLTVRWWKGSSPSATRTVTIRKAKGA